jgi:hypothetical protein
METLANELSHARIKLDEQSWTNRAREFPLDLGLS